MGAETGISWADHTFNPVWGCTKISPACDFCYAADWAARFGYGWGPHAEFRMFGDAHWREPLKWDRAASRDGVRRRVFCASMADVFDNRWPEDVRPRLWALIRATPHLDWLLLTKRPQNIADMLPPDWGDGYPNVWLGVTADNQEEADRRIPTLLRTPARLRFVSCEPLLGPISLRTLQIGNGIELDSFTGYHACAIPLRSMADVLSGVLASMPILPVPSGRIGWIIVGGESGPGARPMHPDWARSVRDQCAAAGVSFHFKQWGGRTPKAGGCLLDGREHKEVPQ